MKRININEYKKDGILIDLEDPTTFNEGHIPGAINIHLDKLLFNYKNLISKDKKYYLYCKKGFKSKRACQILELYGYDVTQIIR